MGRRLIRLGVFVAGVLALFVSSASPAGAVTSPYTRADVAGDTVFFMSRQPVNRPKADIVSIRIDHKSTKIVLRVTTRRGADPATSPLWAPGSFGGITWGIDTSGEPDSAEFQVVLGSRLTPSVYSGHGAVLEECAANSRFVAPATYRVDVPKSCLDNPTRVRAKVGVTYGADAATAVSDASPGDGAFTPFVRPA